MSTESDAKKVVADKKNALYKDVLPLTTGMFDDNTKLGKEKMIATLHRSILGLDKKGALRPINDLKLFMVQASQYGLNPFKKEIYATYIWDSTRQRDELVPIVAIHGLRKLARQSTLPKYAYTGTAKVEKDAEGKLISATVPVYGLFSDNKPVLMTEYTALFEEFARYNSKNELMGNWKRMPQVMLIKCAEANALRQGFNISGIYIEEEVTANNIIEGEEVHE